MITLGHKLIPGDLVIGYQCFGGSFCLHLHPEDCYLQEIRKILQLQVGAFLRTVV
jgi:hypothetical protein